MDDAFDTALGWHAAGRQVALATVVETWGSAPRPAGSIMACDAGGEFVGSVSGGCVEVAVIETAQRMLQEGGAARVLEFGVSNDDAWAVGLACGGRIRVLVEPVQAALLEELVGMRSRAVAQASALDGTERLLLDAESTAGVAPQLAAAAALALRSDAAQRVLVEGREWLVTPHNPALRLIVIGAVHIAESLCAIAHLAGHAVTLIDPRTAFLRPALFPGVALSASWPQAVLPDLQLDARCAAVLLSHDPKIDDPALDLLLRSPAYYIGALGSRRTHARRLERLQNAGHSPESLARIHGPAGLAIGARTPVEIALSIMAQITATLRTEG